MKVAPEKAISEYLTTFIAGQENHDDVHQAIALANLSDAYLQLDQYVEAFIAILFSLAMNYQIDDNVRDRIKRKAKSMMRNFSDEFRGVVKIISENQEWSTRLAFPSQIDFGTLSIEDLRQVINELSKE